jgi:hypothetical protein
MFKEVRDVISYSSCDYMFRKAPSINEYRCWVLSFDKRGKSNAPKYFYMVESPFEGDRLQSLPHANTLYDKFGLKIAVKNPFTLTGQEGRAYEQGYNTEDKHGKVTKKANKNA